MKAGTSLIVSLSGQDAMLLEIQVPTWVGRCHSCGFIMKGSEGSKKVQLCHPGLSSGQQGRGVGGWWRWMPEGCAGHSRPAAHGESYSSSWPFVLPFWKITSK